MQFGSSSFLAFPCVLAGAFAAHRARLPADVAPIALIPVVAMQAWVAWNDDGSLGVFRFGVIIWAVAVLGGVFNLLKALKARRNTAMRLLDERR